MICPLCNTKYDRIAQKCPSCEGDLSALAKISELPDYYYNEAVAAASRGDWFEALESLSAARAFRPADTEALLFLGKIYIELSQLPRASSCFIKALKVDAFNQKAKEALMWLRANGCDIPLQEFLS